MGKPKGGPLDAAIYGDMDRAPNHTEAFEVFLALGRSRTIPKLVAALRKLGFGEVPTEKMLENWYRRWEWGSKLRRADNTMHLEVQSQVIQHNADAAVSEITQLAGRLRSAANKALDRLIEKIPTVEVRTGADVKAIGEFAVALHRNAEILEGTGGGLVANGQALLPGPKGEVVEAEVIEAPPERRLNRVEEILNRVQAKWNNLNG